MGFAMIRNAAVAKILLPIAVAAGLSIATDGVAANTPKTVTIMQPDSGSLPPSTGGFRKTKGCILPVVNGRLRVLVLTTHDGAAISSVSVSGQYEITTAGWVTIEPGQGQFYIIVSASSSMIWMFKGAVERISQVVVVPGWAKEGAGGGVTGVPKEKVWFSRRKNCDLRPSKEGSGQRKIMVTRVQKTLGRQIEKLVSVNELISASLPSGRLAKKASRFYPNDFPDRPANVPSSLWQQLYRFNPEGIQMLDEKAVVAPVPAVRYGVLPGSAGLVQLAMFGYIKVMSDGMLHIVKPIPAFPGGLNGAHSAKFLLGRGIPVPLGKPGRSKVYSEETGLRIH